MWFWWFMLICDLIVPITMIIAGRWMWKHPPKNINGIIGYRTARSMKNLDTWKFAHDYCGRLWWKTGWGMLVVSVVILIPFYSQSEQVVGTFGGIFSILQCALLIVSILPVEKALKRSYTDEGIRK